MVFKRSLSTSEDESSSSDTKSSEIHREQKYTLTLPQRSSISLQTNTQSVDSSQGQASEHHRKIKRKISEDDIGPATKCRLHKETEQIQTSCVDDQPQETRQSTLSSSITNISASSSPLSFPQDDHINILLLGESGVGKSTFINAFVNYLTFPTFKDAESNKPIALIPVSFIITTGHDFTEQIVKLDVPDSSDNEDFEHPGQSVTQQCRTYVFQLKHHNGKKLRIFDTPGFGDTRGLQQDDLNIQHILQYINRFPHLNAVCFLLKPNESRLDISFRTCLMQLLDVLGTNIRQNIVFCFTNSRSTFYTPGNTVSILKSMIKSVARTAIIPFHKTNSFCFDSESFRYLIALKQGISFDDAEKSEYEASWIKSIKEFNRLLHHVEQISIMESALFTKLQNVDDRT